MLYHQRNLTISSSPRFLCCRTAFLLFFAVGSIKKTQKSRTIFPPVYYPAPATRFLWWYEIVIFPWWYIAQVNHKNTKKKEKNGEKKFHEKRGGLKWGILSPSTCASRHKSVTVMFDSVKLNSACSAHLHKSLNGHKSILLYNAPVIEYIICRILPFRKLKWMFQSIFASQGLRSALHRVDRNPWLVKMVLKLLTSFINNSQYI